MIIGLSVVVVTGLVGQISLMQMAFAGIGGFLVSKLGTNLGIPFPWPILLAGLATVPVGVLLGLPAVRVRGINLAVVTLGAAVAVSAVVFQNADWTGGVAGSQVPSPGFWGFSLDPVSHPVRFGIFALAVTVLTIAGVINLRRSPFGRRMLAVRSNERAAAVAGINVVSIKLQAFALSAFIAGIGGGVLAYQLGAVAFDRFSPMASITLLAIVYIGGIATVGGAIAAGVIVNGGVLYVLLSNVGGIASWWLVHLRPGLLVTAVTQPDGIAVAMGQQFAWLKQRVQRSRVAPAVRSSCRRVGRTTSGRSQVAASSDAFPTEPTKESISMQWFRKCDRGRRHRRVSGRRRCGCGGSDSSSSSSSSSSAPAAKTPTGKPIVLYDVTDTSGAGSISAVLQQFPVAEQAAVDYINKDLGGLDGRPFKLVKCDSKADPAATSACANQAVKDEGDRQGRPLGAVGQRQQDLLQGRHRQQQRPGHGVRLRRARRASRSAAAPPPSGPARSTTGRRRWAPSTA